MPQPEKRRIWLYSRKHWWILGLLCLVPFGILYQFPVLGWFNRYPAQVLWYILALNALFIVVVAAFVLYLYREDANIPDTDEGAGE